MSRKKKTKKKKHSRKLSKEEKVALYKERVKKNRSYAKDHGLPDRVTAKMIGAEGVRETQEENLRKNAKKMRLKQAQRRGRQYS